MIVWEDPKNPLETKDYVFDWTKDLGDDEIASASAAFVNGQDAGLTIIQATGFAGPLSSVWVSGGTIGETAVVRGQVQTQDGRNFTEIGLLTVGENADPATASLIQLQADLAALRSARVSLLTGGQIKEVWREGRRIVYNVASYSDLDKAIAAYEGYIADATAATGATKGRFRALSVRF